jgi:hypothetical protein
MHSLKWKNYNNFIEVSEAGDVKSHGKIIKGEICKNGYKRVHVSHNGEQYKILIHRLVATAFIPNPLNKPCVNHKDGNKANNHVDNLEWCTHGENLKHAYDAGLRDLYGTAKRTRRLTSQQVKEIRASYIRGKQCEYNSYGLANKYGVSPKTIQKTVNGKNYTEKLFEEDIQA